MPATLGWPGAALSLKAVVAIHAHAVDALLKLHVSDRFDTTFVRVAGSNARKSRRSARGRWRLN